MPIPIDYVGVIEQLEESTLAHILEWKNQKFGFETAIANSKFSIWAGDDGDTGIPFVAFAMLDESGNTLDSFYVEPDDDDYETMRLFFSMAKRYALKIPSRLESVKKALQDLNKQSKNSS